MTIKILPKVRDRAPHFDSTFALQQDNWNDFGFQTQYHLYYRQTEKPSPHTMVGSVKILKHGQTKSDGIQISQPFETLDTRFCSVGTSLDYYQRLNEIAQNEREEILSALRDVVYQPELREEFREERGWLVSLFRDNQPIDEFLVDARAILTGNFSALPDISNPISFWPANWSTPLTFDFDAQEPMFYDGTKRRLGPSGKDTLLPRRINVIIGRNGSGKSSLLSRLARVGFVSPSDREKSAIKALGAFERNSVGFVKIITISYSPFDNFMVPGLYEDELQQLAFDMEKGSGRYIYAGLRDIVAEVRDDLNAPERKLSPNYERKELTGQDRRTTTRLKSLAKLADEFHELINRIAASDDNALLDSALEPLFAESSFADLESKNRSELLRADPREAFLGWSTGHKIVMHVIASLVSHTTRRSLVLFDEPEMHLHPPLIAALMHSVRIVLEEKEAIAIVATHSPVILQETLGQHVHIIRRIGQDFNVLKPDMETFGENVGVLTYDAFGLTADSTDFHKYLDILIENFSDLEEINQLFSPRLSGQALSYVMAGLARKAIQ